MYSISENILNIDGREIILETTIDKVLEYNNLTILMLLNTPLTSKQIDNNIVAYNVKGEEVWKIQDARELYPIKEPTLYVHMGIDEQGRLFGTTYLGIVYYVDVNTGKILDRSWTK